MSDLIKYNWWGFGSNEPPPHLKTKKQLSEIGLSPVNPVGFIETSKYTLYLYDPNNNVSVKPKKKPSEKQLENLKKGRAKQKYLAWKRHEGRFERDRLAAVCWARDLLEAANFLIIDTEATGLSAKAEIVEVAIINAKSETLINTLVKPRIPNTPEAISVHKITDEMLQNAPLFPEVYPRLQEILTDNLVIAYGTDFDVEKLKYCCKIHKLPKIKFQAQCLRDWYAQWYGEYSSYHQDYKCQPLYGGHRALSDCLKALEFIKEMAADTLETITVEDFYE